MLLLPVLSSQSLKIEDLEAELLLPVSGYRYQTGVGSEVSLEAIFKKWQLKLKTGYERRQYGFDEIEAIWNTLDPGQLQKLDIENHIRSSTEIEAESSLYREWSKSKNLSFDISYKNKKEYKERYRLRYEDFQPLDSITYRSEIRRQSKGSDGSIPDEMDIFFNAKVKYETGLPWGKWENKIMFDYHEDYRDNRRFIEFNDRHEVFKKEKGLPLVIPIENLSASAFDFKNAGIRDLRLFDRNLEWESKLKIPINKNKLNVKGGIKYLNNSQTSVYSEFEPFENLLLTEVPLADPVPDTKEFYISSQYTFGLFPTIDYLHSVDFYDRTKFKFHDVKEEYIARNFRYKALEFKIHSEIEWKKKKWKAEGGLEVKDNYIRYNAFSVSDLGEPIPILRDSAHNFLMFNPRLKLSYEIGNKSEFSLLIQSIADMPEYNYLIPYEEILADEEEVRRGNSGLLPSRMSEVELELESKKFKELEIELKLFTSYINDPLLYFYDPHLIVGEFRGFEFWQWRQGEKGYRTGASLEVSYSPGFLKNVQFDGEYDYRSTVVTYEERTIPLPQTPRHEISFSAEYSGKNWEAGGSLSAHSDQLISIATTNTGDIYLDNYAMVSMYAARELWKDWKLALQVENLTNTAIKYYQYKDSYESKITVTRPWFLLFLKYDII